MLYIYYFTQRKKQHVITKMWLIILVGLIAGVSGRLIDVNLGNLTWGSIQISLILSAILVCYCLWKLLSELKKDRE